jgi:hypothetical protein
MRNCRVFHPERTRVEDVPLWEFAGNKPAVPPLMTEAVASVVYVVDDIQPKS